jgi:chemotaxis protein MotB
LLRKEINQCFTRIIKKYSDFFQHFEGDDSAPQVAQIEQILHTFLNEENGKKATSQRPSSGTAKYLWGIGAILGIGALYYWGEGAYERYRLEQEIFRSTGAQITLDEEDGKLYARGHLKQFQDLYTITDLLQRQTSKPVINELFVPLEALDKQLQAQQKSLRTLQEEYRKRDTENEEERKRLQTQLTHNNSTIQHLKQQLDTLQKKLGEDTQAEKTRQSLLHKIALLNTLPSHLVSSLEASPVLKGRIDPNTGALILQSKNLFEAGSATPNSALIGKIDQMLVTYIRTLMQDQTIRPYIKAFVIKGYTDSSGSMALNRKLSEQRAEEIKKHLLSLPIADTYKLERLLQTKGMGSKNPVMINGEEDKEASRRIEITALLDTKKIKEKIDTLTQALRSQ